MNRMVIVAAFAIALSGCLSVETEISLSDDGSGRMDMVYTIDREFYELGVFDNSDMALPIPVSEAEFREAVRLHEGLRLRRYRSREEENSIVIEVRLEFESVEALSAWYGGSEEGGEAITLEAAGGRTVWHQLLYPGDGADGEIAEALGESLEGYALSYTLRPPREVVSATPGVVSSGRKEATISIGLDEIVRAVEPVFWDVRW